MGLDVYLRRCDDKATADAAEQQHGEAIEKLYSDKSLSDEDRRKQIEVLNQEFGIQNFRHQSIEAIEIASALHPDHTFKIGYMRSSYNESGTNSVLADLGIADLYAIFAHDEDYEFVPDWVASKARCAEALEKLRVAAQGPAGKYAVTKVDSIRPECQSTSAAMRLFEEHLSRETTYGYSNSHGLFAATGEPMKVHAIIAGRCDFLGKPMPATYVVYESENRLDWYIQALEVVGETIDYVLAHAKPETFYLAWSG